MALQGEEQSQLQRSLCGECHETIVAASEGVNTSGMGGEVVSPHGVDETDDVMVVQEENMVTKMGSGMKNKIPSTMYEIFVSHVITKVKSLKSSYAQQHVSSTLYSITL